ncbi:MAG: FAD-dependent oxidoreductase, partial [Planctomycetota bacterium]|nr:FAD-dependent oxidoreductase [Planctomycetota bacterium]
MMKVDPRYLTADGPEIFTGNELLLKGALEADGGVHLLGGYPGSPIAGFFDSMALVKDLLSEKGIRAVMNSNEALAAAMLNGSQTLPVRAMIVVKSVGVHVAADALALANLAGANPDGGAIVVYGDDPWSDSTQVPADSRYISKHLFIPVIEPSNPQEVKDFVDCSFKLSRRSGLLAGYILTTNLADGGGTVVCRPNQYPALNTRQRVELATKSIDFDKRVLLPPRTWWQEESFSTRHAEACRIARELKLNRIEHPPRGRRPVGFVTSGLAYGYLTQALWEMGLLGELPVLKLGMSYPMDAELVRELANQCERIIVVEERRGFLEEQIGEVLLADRQRGLASGQVELWGKKFPAGLKGIPATRGLHPSVLISRLAPLLKSVRASAVTAPADLDALDREVETIRTASELEFDALPARLASFCPGCPHRDSANVCLEIKKQFMDTDYMRRRHKSKTVDLMFHGDTGCYTMLMFPPNTPLMHDYSGMGLGAGTGSGTDPFITNKEVVFMGDSTFFHSGQLAISQAVKFGQDITFILLNNDTTAMTGHQPTPGVDYDIIGNPTPQQDIEDIINGMTGDSNLTVVRADPQQRSRYRELLEKTFLADGVKVIIAEKECAITRMRRKRRQERAVIRRRGYLPTREHMNINPEICRFCLACAEMTGCPGLKHRRTDYGLKMDTDITWCVSDGACERVGACSAFERVTIKRKRPPRSRVPELALDDIPEPKKRSVGDLWRCCLVGVGGMGIGVATSIVVRAGHKEGYPVIFVDKKGLAIRNGGVISQVVYNVASEPITAVIPYGKADLLIGIDILEAARAIDPTQRMRIASKDHTAAVINTDKINTISGLMGRDDFDVERLESTVRRYTRRDETLARDISRICEKYLGSKLYANIMMLGFAFQKGLIPVSMHSMAWAIKDTIHTDFRKNLYAFNMGRKLVVQPDLFQGPPQRTDWRDVLEEKCRWTIRRFGRRGQAKAAGLRELVTDTTGSVKDLAEELKCDLVVRAYDCMRWGGLRYARRYCRSVAAVYGRDLAKFNYAATRAVIHNLAKAMLIKDAVFLAELATGPEKYAHDREKYNVNPANGDKIVYRHLWHIKLKLGRWKLPVNVALRRPALKYLRTMRWCRKLPIWCADEKKFLRQYEVHAAEFAASELDLSEPTYAPGYANAVAKLGSPQCLQCLNPRCSEAGCPLQGAIPDWVDLAYQNQWRAASDLLHAANNFPEITSRICPAPCQVACKQSLNDYPVQIRQIERQVVDRAFAAGWITPKPATAKTHKSIGIIGSGPAGLAAAQQLARKGHNVTVLEKETSLGGLLRTGIPPFRLERELLDRRLAQLRAEGVAFRTGVAVGHDIPAAKLFEQFDAVCLATGAAVPRDLNVPGRNSQGILFAMDFLRQHNLSQAQTAGSAAGKIVAVIGGGLTGNDCVEVAHLQGAKQIHQLEILPEAEVDSDVWNPPHLNGVHRRWCVATKKFDGNGGRLAGIEGVEVRWLSSPGGRIMQEIPGSEFAIPADLVLLAMGFEAKPDDALAGHLGLAIGAASRLVVNDCVTNNPRVFAAG